MSKLRIEKGCVGWEGVGTLLPIKHAIRDDKALPQTSTYLKAHSRARAPG